MATITKIITIWVNDDTRAVFTEKEIAEIKRDKIADYHADRDRLYEKFDIWCEDEGFDFADLFFANEEKRADYLARFDKYLEELAEEYIEENYLFYEVETEVEVTVN